MAFAGLLWPKQELSDLRKGRTLTIEGKTFRSRKRAQEAMEAEIDDVDHRKLPVVAVIVEVDQSGKVLDYWRWDGAHPPKVKTREANPPLPIHRDLYDAITAWLGKTPPKTISLRSLGIRASVSTHGTFANIDVFEDTTTVRRGSKVRPSDYERILRHVRNRTERAAQARLANPGKKPPCQIEKSAARAALKPVADKLGCSVDELAKAARRRKPRSSADKPNKPRVEAAPPAPLSGIAIDTEARLRDEGGRGISKLDDPSIARLSDQIAAHRVANPEHNVVALVSAGGDIAFDATKKPDQALRSDERPEGFKTAKAIALPPLSTGNEEYDAAHREHLEKLAAELCAPLVASARTKALRQARAFARRKFRPSKPKPTKPVPKPKPPKPGSIQLYAAGERTDTERAKLRDKLVRAPHFSVSARGLEQELEKVASAKNGVFLIDDLTVWKHAHFDLIRDWNLKRGVDVVIGVDRDPKGLEVNHIEVALRRLGATADQVDKLARRVGTAGLAEVSRRQRSAAKPTAANNDVEDSDKPAAKRGIDAKPRRLSPRDLRVGDIILFHPSTDAGDAFHSRYRQYLVLDVSDNGVRVRELPLVPLSIATIKQLKEHTLHRLVFERKAQRLAAPVFFHVPAEGSEVKLSTDLVHLHTGWAAGQAGKAASVLHVRYDPRPRETTRVWLTVKPNRARKTLEVLLDSTVQPPASHWEKQPEKPYHDTSWPDGAPSKTTKRSPSAKPPAKSAGKPSKADVERELMKPLTKAELELAERLLAGESE